MEKAWVEAYKRYRRKESGALEPQTRKQSGEAGSDREKVIFGQTGTYVLGPVLDGFVVWVLKNAVRTGKKRLYFLARDGYFMYRAAEIYTEKLGLSLECRYLYCSRYALRLSVFHLDIEDAMEYICRDSIGLNLSRIMNRVGLEEGEQKTVLEEIKEAGKENDPIPYARLEEIKKKLKGSAAFLKALIRHSEEALPALTGYLAQEGLLDGVQDALVDSGWVGSMQKTMNTLLEIMGRKRRIEGYYWGLYELPYDIERKEYHCYYFSPEGQLREKVYFNNNLFEAVFSAPHGMTVGYEEKEGHYRPICTPVSEKRKQQMQRLENVLMRYVEHKAASLQDIADADCGPEKKYLKRLLRMFMGHPTAEEAEVYGKLFFCDDVLEYAGRQLAEKMSEKDLRANHVVNKILVMTGLRKSGIKESAWYEGSAARDCVRPAWHLFQYRLYKYLLYIRQMYKWRKSNVQKKTEKQKN